MASDPFAGALAAVHDDPFKGATSGLKGDPFASLRGAAVGAGSAALDILGRPGAAVTSGIARGGGAAKEAFLHGRSGSQTDADMETVRQKLGNTLGDPGFAQRYHSYPHAVQGVLDALIGFDLDPTSAAGGAGVIERGVNAAGRQAYVAGAKGLNTLGKHAPPIAAGIAAAHDAVTPGGARMAALKRTLAAREGTKGLDSYTMIRSIEKGGKNTTAGLENGLNGLLKDATKGLRPEEEQAVYQLVDRGSIDKLTPAYRKLLEANPALAQRAKGVEDVWKSLRYLEGTKGVRSDLERGRVVQKATPATPAEEPNLWRAQSTSGAEVSPRGGTFFATAPHVAGLYKGTGGRFGGEHLIPGVAQPKNLLDLAPGAKPPTPGGAFGGALSDNPVRYNALDKLLPRRPFEQPTFSRSDLIESNIEELGKSSKNAARYLKAVGVPDAEIADVLKRMRREGHSAAVLDRMVAEVAKRHGYDAVKNNAEFFALHPDAVRAPRPGVAGTPEVRAGGGFTLPDQLKPFAGRARGLQRSSQVREAYMPHTAFTPEEEVTDALHGILPTGEEERVFAGSGSRKGLGTQDPHLKPRTTTSGIYDDPAIQRAVNSGRIFTGARSIGNKDTRNALAAEFGNGRKAFDNVPGDIRLAFREDVQKAKRPGDPGYAGELLSKGAKAGTRGMTSAMFAVPQLPGMPGHGSNIAQLALLSNPGAALAGTARFFGSGEALPFSGLRSAAQKLPGVRGLAEGQGAAVERGAKTGAVTLHPEDFGRPGIFDKVPGVNMMARESNRSLQAYDNAVKGALNDHWTKYYERAGYSSKMAAAKAAERVGQDVVDYSDKSDLTRALQHFLPFATFATKKPGVVGRAVARHPERVLALTRNNPNFAQDRTEAMSEPDTGRPLASLYNAMNNKSPSAKGGAPFPGAQYTRAALGDVWRDLLGAAGAHYFTYGDPGRKDLGWLKLVLSQALGPVPGGDAALSKLGLNYFDR